ncbi:hypothetical protein MTQ13_27455, partial [Streptomyces sp. XM4011]|uniref:hypothetical protein n=1 Tax=Streptomyces sp. XM4011 TaxID=2929780 RepID=UPI001FF88384
MNVTGWLPYRFDNSTRTAVPPADTCTAFRSDRPPRPSRVPGSAPVGAADQAPTHAPCAAGTTDPGGPG